jgi:transcription antitermination factor NusG
MGIKSPQTGRSSRYEVAKNATEHETHFFCLPKGTRKLKEAMKVPEVDPADASPWYVAHVKPRAERRALKELTDLGVTAFVPSQRGWTVRRGYKVEYETPIFPGYLFFTFGDGAARFAAVTDLEEVISIITVAASPFPKPFAVPAQVVHALLERQRRNFMENGQTTPTFQAGEQIRIKEGPFVGFNATVEKVLSETDRQVLVSLFNRATSLRVGIEHLERAC